MTGFVWFGAVLCGLLLNLVAPSTEASAQGPILQLCLAEAADASPVFPTQTFASPVKELLAVFRLGTGESYKTLAATWIAVDVGDAAPANYQIAQSILSLKDARNGKLRYSQPQPLPVGAYRLVVTADGKPWKSADFTVTPPIDAPKLKQPHELLPLREGQVWTYAFVQEAGEGSRVRLPDVTPGTDGKFRASVTMTVAATDPAGTRIDMRRNGKLVFQEWWQLDNKGLAATQRKTEEELVVLTPPQILWHWPLKTPKKWDYKPKDKSYKQTYHMWGPVPVKGPSGEAPGYVVLVEQPSRLLTTTVERHFLPGVGLVREVMVSALGGKMVNRQELVLKP